MKIEFPNKEGRFEQPVFFSCQYGHYDYPTDYYKAKGCKDDFIYGTHIRCRRDGNDIGINLFKLDRYHFKSDNLHKYNYITEGEYQIAFANILTFDLE